MVVKGANVELVSESFPGAIAQLQNLQLANLVGQRLAGPCNVTVHLGLNGGLVNIRVGAEVFDHLVAGPALGMHAGVDDEADGAPHFVLQPAVIGVGVLVQADILAQMLGHKILQKMPKAKILYIRAKSSRISS